jgi:hypothetical protein
MTRPWWLSLLLFTILVALVSSTDPVKNEVNVLRSLKSINASNANVKQCVWFAMQEYNKENKDKYVFLVSKIMPAQLQVKVISPNGTFACGGKVETRLKKWACEKHVDRYKSSICECSRHNICK